MFLGQIVKIKKECDGVCFQLLFNPESRNGSKGLVGSNYGPIKLEKGSLGVYWQTNSDIDRYAIVVVSEEDIFSYAEVPTDCVTTRVSLKDIGEVYALGEKVITRFSDSNMQYLANMKTYKDFYRELLLKLGYIATIRASIKNGLEDKESK